MSSTPVAITSEDKRFFIQIMDAVMDGICVIGADFTIQVINRSEAAYYGRPRRELLGRKCYEIFRQRTSVCPDCYVQKCLDDGQARHRRRLERRRLGRPYVDAHYYPIVDRETGASRGVVVCIQDVTASVELENRVVMAEKMVSLGRVTAGISHDLNNYLASISGIVQLIQIMKETGCQDERKEEKLCRHLANQVEALTLLAKNLSLFSHPSQEEKFPLSLNQVVGDVLSFSRYELERDRVEVVCELAADLPAAPMVKTQIQQALLNLVLNAVQAIRVRKNNDDAFAGPGRIVVRTERAGADQVALVVVDDGCGIPPEKREMIFAPFYSTKAHGSEDEWGTGLGLSTVKMIVDRHGGQVEFTSEENQGTTFTIRLPLAK